MRNTKTVEQKENRIQNLDKMNSFYLNRQWFCFKVP
jgi:hypothetical protein